MKNLSADRRYDVILGLNDYAVEVDRRLVMDAVLEILIMKEKGEAALNEVITIQDHHSGRREGPAGDREGGLRLVDGAGRTVSTIPDGTVFGIDSESPRKEWGQKNWDGEEVTVSYPLNSGKVDDATQADYLNPMLGDDD